MPEIPIEQGRKVLVGTQIVEILAVISLSKIQVRDFETGNVFMVEHGDVRAEIKDDRRLITLGSKEVGLSEAIDGASEEEMLKARQRFEIIRGYKNREPDAARSAKELETKLSLGKSQVYRLLERYDEALGPLSVLDSKPGKKKGSTTISGQINNIIEEAIDSVYKGLGATESSVFETIEVACTNAGLKAPAKRTVSKRLQARGERALSEKKYGVKKSQQDYQSRGGKIILTQPLQMVQIDHARCDVVVVDHVARLALARPWVTLAIDVYTRVILGVYLSLHHPSSMSVAMCIANCIIPKNKWLSAMGLDSVEYPFYGIPHRIHWDNAKEFKTRSCLSGCLKYNIKSTHRPPGVPHNGAHIERMVKTLMVRTHMLPGTTMSNVQERLDYNSEKNACMTFTEFREWFVSEIEIYHKTRHSALNCSPLFKWEESFRGANGELAAPPVVDNQLEVLLSFMPLKSRTIQRAGVHMFDLEYYSPALKVFDNKIPCEVRYDPGSIKHIWVKPEGASQYVELTYSDVTLPDISYAEYKMYKTEYSAASGRRVSGVEVFELKKANAARVEVSKAQTKSERRRNAIDNLRVTDKSHPLHKPFNDACDGSNEVIDYSRKPATFRVEED